MTFQLQITPINIILPPMMRKRIFHESFFLTLRIEELIGLFFMVASIAIASLVNIIFYTSEIPDSHNMTAVVARLLISTLFVLLLYAYLIPHAKKKWMMILRDFAPILFVPAIYFNLQDVVFLIHPTDVHNILVDLDSMFMGMQPTVWAESFYHPLLTDWFSLSYLNYYFITPSLLILLFSQKKVEQFRVVIVTVMTSYYIGFLGYIIFPASSPYLVIPDQYSVDIWKDTGFFSWLTYTLVDLSPQRVRDAFPSMHNAVVLLTMILAWRYQHKFFWIQLPLACSLPFATVYLRYHYVVDILAAIPVVILALYAGPYLERWWLQYQNSEPSKGISAEKTE